VKKTLETTVRLCFAYTGCSFKFILKIGVENAPLIRLQSKTTNNAKSEVRFK
jgi:hypothetical protein